MLQLSQRRSEGRGRGSWLVRRRVQLAGALVVAALLPFLWRITFTPHAIDAATYNAAVANTVAVLVAFWLRLSFEPYPGIRSSYVILPTAAAAHGVVLAFFFFSRLPYDRFGFLAGFLLHVLWFYVVYFLAQRRTRLRIGVVPIGSTETLTAIDSVDWLPLARPRTELLPGCDALVADFSADLPAEWESFLADAALAGTIVYQVKPLEESLTGRVRIDHLSENSFGSLVPARGYFHLKTVLDWLAALLSLPLLLPLMALAALAILADDGGPVLFRQHRIGHRGQRFMVNKFRTMRVGANHALDARRAAMTGDLDPRITRVGAFLRQTRLDELPQVFNILAGQMSWIGPRPEAEVLSLWYVGELPFYRYRHVVKPGITGWAQVSQGHVAQVAEVHRKLHYDFYYIKYFSPWLDVLILFKTVKTIFSGFGAR
ncbi:sugar transferase [Sphingomonas sp. BN140010]|uniref:Sugar transferase n=1 Tax=Sphingomonas arvum TaxID=2992113 RepID=A0ABT3JD28_9SPHN|nr:sugar transferase [Sphingomonas sp. BN140010]MCW3796972.1 sugar transferase [Sphingomonas sp. BN140010]